MPDENLMERVYEYLAPIALYPYRMVFSFPDLDDFQMTRLRGVWGRALHTLDRDVYCKIFEGGGSKQLATPRYLIRPSFRDGSSSDASGRADVAVDFIFWGATERDLDVVTRAWHIATQFGLGRERRPFEILHVEPRYLPVPTAGLSLALILQALADAGSPFAARFRTPVRLLEHGALISEPTFEELMKRVLNRLATIRLQSLDLFESQADSARPAELRPAFYSNVMELAKLYRASPWRGERYSFRRYSASQRAELELRGTLGGWELYAPLGALRPLVDAATVLGVGKSTTLGLGSLLLDYA